MKLRLGTLLAMTLGCAPLVAQTPQVGETVTFAGCLQRAQLNGSVGGTAVGTSASPNTADDDANSGLMVNAFLLSEATPVVRGVAEPERSATTAAAGAATATGTSGRVEMTSFALAGREAELERHQGARLQVTGKVAPPASSGRGSGGSATASGVKRLQVESFKILAEKCQAQ